MAYQFVSGHLGLDLAGTVAHRDGPDRLELLPGPAALARWAVAAGLTDDAPAADRAELAATIELREAIFRMARARLAGEPPKAADRALLNRAAAPAPVAVRLAADGSVRREGDLTAVRSSIARATVELLGGPAAMQLKACGATPCSRLYLDSSRRGARRWCDMRECGNRAKAAAYRRRHGAGTPARREPRPSGDMRRVGPVAHGEGMPTDE